MAVINGTSGDDNLPGTTGPDIINGYAGNDILFGGSGDDSMYGGEGDDTFLLDASAGTDYYDGGAGYDVIGVANVLSAFNYVDVGIGTLTSIEAIVNNDTKPVYLVTNGVLDLTGIKLIDISGFKGSATNDYMTGESVFNSSTSTWSGINMWGYGGNDQMAGSARNDVIDGGDGDDILVGRGGADTILGGAGFDKILGEAGDDTLTGGAGVDWFWFEANQGADIITDYVDGTDKIVVGTSLSSINLYNYTGGSTLIEFNGGSTYAILQGVAASSIDASDFLWA